MLIALDQINNSQIEVGELITVVVVRAANAAKDFLENVKNVTGGKMTHYEGLIQNALQEALKQLEEEAKQKGYDGVVGVKICHPTVVIGGVEIIVYGNGFKESHTPN
jgi:uncharacterized protein YbjQ (UPF0145 family)